MKTNGHLGLELGGGPSISDWLPGETLFSLASRHHWVAGNFRAAETCLQLFGHPRSGSSHDLPGRVAQFVSRTEGRFGTADEVIRHHTLLPYYLPFRPLTTAMDAFAAMTGDSVGTLKARLGILATRFGAAHPLKACQRCITADQENHGVGYWHVEHQLPGVWVCPWHGALLLASQVKSTGVDRFGWYLPDFAELNAAQQTTNPDLGIPTLKRLAEAAISLWSLPKGCHVSDAEMAFVYRDAMIKRGLCSASGRLNVRAFGQAVVNLTCPLRAIRELSGLPDSAEEAASQFSHIVSNPRSTPHPLKHLVLILVLYGTWDAMWIQYQQTHKKRQRQGEPTRERQAQGECVSPTPVRHAQLLEALAAHEGSMRAAAAHVGISIKTAMAWAAQAGIASQRRAKVLTPEVRQRLIRVLRRGIGKTIVAHSFGISIQTVTTTLQTEVGLHECWAGVRFTKAQQRARQAWALTSTSLAFSTPKQLRDLQPAVFAWLYRNDRAWLETFSSQLERVPRSNNATIDWDQRDQNLAQSIQTVALQWHEDLNIKRLTIAGLCVQIPDLKPRLSKLDRMPLTRAALSRISGRSRKAQAFLL